MTDNYGERISKVEGRVDTLMQEHIACRAQVQALATAEAETGSSTKSAHKRVDETRAEFHASMKEFRESMQWTLAMSVTVVGIFASVLTWALGR